MISAPDSPHKHYIQGLIALISADHEQAKKEFTAVLSGWDASLRSSARNILSAYEEYALFPQSPQIHLLTLLSRALADSQECELALPMLSQVTRTQDDYRDAWIVQGYCELTTERYQESLTSLERAYQLDPEKAETQYFLARAQSALGDHAQAVTFLQYALENGFEPEPQARLLLAEEALSAGNASLALDQYDALTKLPGSTLSTFSDAITAALTAGKKEEALVKAEEAAKRWPDEAVALDLLGWAQLQNGDREHAKESFQKALGLNPNLASAKEHLKQL
jgi:tetratricopeptide (TPR) repeat protein